jgi:phenol hydroxylase P0 protein
MMPAEQSEQYPSRPHVSQCFVRLLRRRPDGFVEFVFSISDPELGVELILPASAYAQFCAENRVRFLTED